MSIWQYTFYLLPLAVISERHGSLPSRIDEFLPVDYGDIVDGSFDLDADGFNYWASSQNKLVALTADIAALMPEQHTWQLGERSFGENNGTEIQLSREDCVCKFDVRRLNVGLLYELLKAADELQLIVVVGDSGLVLPPKMLPIVENLLSSRAFKWTIDPLNTLRGIDCTNRNPTGQS